MAGRIAIYDTVDASADATVIFECFIWFQVWN